MIAIASMYTLPISCKPGAVPRAREVAVENLRRKRQQVSAFLLRQGRHYPGERAWSKAHRDWLVSQKLEYAEHRIAFEEMLLAMRQAQERIERLEQTIPVAVPESCR
jgi:hypothetical protein